MDRGPNIVLDINYNSSTLANPDGLGLGWSWNLTHFNPLNNQLSTSQGQAFHLDKIDKNHWWPHYHKLKNIRIDGSKKTHFVITYSNALREILNHDGYEIRLEQQDGRGVDFDYLPGTHLLSSITDDMGHKISLTYNNNYINITSYSSDGSRVTVRISHVNGQLHTISFPVTKSQDYKNITINYNRSLLSDITYPTGLVKNIEYNCNNEMKLSVLNGQDHALCVVTKTSVNPGFGQPNIVVNYTYDHTSANEHNYLAYNSGLSLLQYSNQDILFDTPANYTYQTTIDNGLVKQIHTFNKYHLLIDVKTVSDSNDHLLTETQNLFCRTDSIDGCAQTSFEKLPLTYDLPLKTVTKTWGDTPGSLPVINTTIKRYDKTGRLIMTKDSYGREKRIDYCPAYRAVLSGCPQEPSDWSLISMVHSTTTSAPGSGLPPVSEYNVYRKLPNINGKGYMLLQARKDIYAGAHHVVTIRDYYDNPKDVFTYGLLKKTSFYQNLTANSHNKPIVRYYHYTVNADHSVKTSYSEVVLDADHHKVLRSPSVSTSLFTNQMLSETDAEGHNTSHYAYDFTGRITQIDLAVGTPFATSKRYEYTLSPKLNQVLMIAGNGLKRKIIFDGAGRALKHFDTALSSTGTADNTWRITHSTVYDTYGRVAAEYNYIPFDRNASYRNNALYQTISLATKLDYDNRGRVTAIHLLMEKKV